MRHFATARWAFQTATHAGLVILLAAFALPLWAGKPSGSGVGSYKPVTTYLSDYDAGNAAYLLQSDGSYGLKGIAGEYDDGQQGVTSHLWTSRTGGGWQLNLTSSTRSVRLTVNSSTFYPTSDFSEDPGIEWTSKSTVAKVEDKCYAAGNDPVRMTAVGSMDCPLIISQIPAGNNGDTYGLSMVGQYAASTSADKSTLARITCTHVSATDGYCDDWVITPIPNADGTPGTAVASFQEAINTRKSSTTNYYGYYKLTFRMHITRP